MLNSSLFNISWLYNFTQSILGGYRFTEQYTLRQHLHPILNADTIVIDYGCGTGRLAEFLANDVLYYFGVDINERNIYLARRNYTNLKNTSFQSEIGPILPSVFEKDVVIVMVGVMHHLSDSEITEIFTLFKSLPVRTLKFVTCDPVHTPSQNPLARGLMLLDRGKFIRSSLEYEKLINILEQRSYCVTLVHNPKELLFPYDNLIITGEVTK